MVAYCPTPAVLTLTLGTTVLDLMDQANGFRVSEVDLGYPDVREDVDDRADAQGVNDYTRLFGARAITISGSLVPSATGSRSRALHALAPFLNPGARPVLTYQIDPDTPARMMTLRPAQWAAPFNDRNVSAFQVGWKAPDPLAYDANLQRASVWPAPVGGNGRTYNLVFNRVYGTGGGSTSAITPSVGDMTVYPTLRLYGPMSSISVIWRPTAPGIVWNTYGSFGFVSTFTINGGDRVDVDCRRRTAYLNGNPGQSVFSSILVTGGNWPFIPAPGQTSWQITATSTSPVSQMAIEWQDAYLL